MYASVSISIIAGPQHSLCDKKIELLAGLIVGASSVCVRDSNLYVLCGYVIQISSRVYIDE